MMIDLLLFQNQFRQVQFCFPAYTIQKKKVFVQQHAKILGNRECYFAKDNPELWDSAMIYSATSWENKCPFQLTETLFICQLLIPSHNLSSQHHDSSRG